MISKGLVIDEVLVQQGRIFSSLGLATVPMHRVLQILSSSCFSALVLLGSAEFPKTHPSKLQSRYPRGLANCSLQLELSIRRFLPLETLCTLTASFMSWCCHLPPILLWFQTDQTDETDADILVILLPSTRGTTGLKEAKNQPPHRHSR